MFFRRALLPVLLALAAALGTAYPALAHDEGPHNAAEAWAAWSLEPGVLILIGLSAVLYARGWRVQARRAGGASRRLQWQVWPFAAGMLVLAAALISPLDALAGELFWVHMLQHTLLMLVAAPLLVLAAPLTALLLGLPRGWAHRLGRSWQRMPGLRGLWGLVSSPPTAWLLQAVTLWLWHAPVLYQQAVENEGVHLLQHASFFGPALLYWWVILHTFGVQVSKRGVAVLYLFTTAMHSGLLGALLTFSTRLWYPVYAGRSENWNISALADQQLAGTIMWVPAGLVYLAVALWLMKSWLDAMENQEDGGYRNTPPTDQSLIRDPMIEKERG